MEKKKNIDTKQTKFNERQGEVLLKIARKNIAEKLGYDVERVDIPDEKIFNVKRGVFVTLKINNQLRGCIGNLEPILPVVKGIAGNAINAAFKDYRFSPLSKDDFHKIDIEVSILTKPVLLKYETADQLISKLRPGIDGVIVKKGNAGATFLPQVWEQLPEPVEFLEHLCEKAGLSSNAWQSGELVVSTYQVQYFEE